MGYQILAEVWNSQFEQKDQLKQALECFVRAVKTQRNSAEAFVGLAYLLMLIQENEQAKPYLREALRLNPRQADAQKLLKALYLPPTQVVSRSNPPPSVPAPLPSSPLPVNSLTPEQLLLDIQRACQAAQEKVLPLPSGRADDLENLTQTLEQFNLSYRDLKAELKMLEAEEDCTALEIALYPFEKIIREWKKNLAVNEAFQSLLQKIAKQTQQSQKAIFTLKSSQGFKQIEIYESRLEFLLDSCDRFADEIDLFQEQGFATHELENCYAQLLETVESFREALDEAQGNPEA